MYEDDMIKLSQEFDRELERFSRKLLRDSFILIGIGVVLFVGYLIIH